MQQTWIARRQVAFQHHLASELLGGVFDRGGQHQPVLCRVERREEHVDNPVARLDAECGAHQIVLALRNHGKFLRDRTKRLGTGAHRRCGMVEGLARRQRWVRSERIGLAIVLQCVGIFPGQAVQRQPIADRRIARQQEQRAAAKRPLGALPHAYAVADRSPQRQHGADRRAEALAEYACQSCALHRVREFRVLRQDIRRQAMLAPQVIVDVLVGLVDQRRIDLQPLRQCGTEPLRVRCTCGIDVVLRREQGGIAPHRFAVLAPMRIERPARQLLARIVFAGNVLQGRSG